MRTIGLVAALSMAGTLASAQQYCADRGLVTQRLEAGYGEKFAGGGLRNENSVFEVWYSDKDRTWTILMTRADGTSCVMASGTDWRIAMPSERVAGVPG